MVSADGVVRPVQQQVPCRGVEGVSQGGVVVVVEAGTTPPDPQLVRHLQEGETRFTCRVIILDLTAATNVNEAVM